MQLNAYLCFEGRCEEAIEFYKQALGAEVLMCMRFSETPPAPEGSSDGCCPGGAELPGHKIAHAALKIGTTEIYMSDGMNSGQAEFKGTTLSLSVSNDAEARKTFDALSAGGQVLMDLNATFFASSWGYCNDKFGVPWMVLAPVPVGV